MYAASTANAMISGRSRDERVARAAEAHRVEDGLDADQLQRDVGHRREDAGDRDRQREPAAAVAAAHEVGRGHVAVPVRDAPHPRHEDEDDRVDDDRVRHREEAAHRAGRVHRRRHRDERVGGVEVAAEQEPGDRPCRSRGRPAPTRPGCAATRARRQRAAQKPPTVTTTKKKMTTPSSTPLTPVPSASHAARRSRPLAARASRSRRYAAPGEHRGDEHPQQLVPVEEREAPQLAASPTSRSARAPARSAGSRAARRRGDLRRGVGQRRDGRPVRRAR